MYVGVSLVVVVEPMNLGRILLQLKNSLPEENQNRLSLFTGGRGKGKTWGSMSVGCSVMGDKFSPVDNIGYFDAWDFMSKVRKSPKGDVDIFDDAGVGIDNRLWMYQSNILFSQLVQTFRTRNLWCIVNVPSISYIDIKVRKMFHDFVVFMGVNKKKGFSTAKWYEMSENKFTGELYFRPMKVSNPNDPTRTMNLEYIKFVAPPKPVTDKYEELRAVALDKLFGKIDEFQMGGGRIITVSQAASMLGAHKNLVWGLVADGSLPIYKESQSIKIPLSWVRKVRSSLGIGKGKGELYVVEASETPKLDSFLELPDGRLLAYGEHFPDLYLKCKKCSHIWKYRGVKRETHNRVTCPDCGGKFYLGDLLYNYYNIKRRRKK